jgi:hypothetical protein
LVPLLSMLQVVQVVLLASYGAPATAPPSPPPTQPPVPAPGGQPSCTSLDDHHWPRFNDAAELADNKPWFEYLQAVYGDLPTSSFPICTFDFNVLRSSAPHTSHTVMNHTVMNVSSTLKDGDLFRSKVMGGFQIYHETWQPAANDSWIEIAHAVYPTELEGMWVWNARGSGVWANVGRTIVFPTPVDPSKTHAEAIAYLRQGCSKTPSWEWPQLESDIFGFCAREKGIDSIQFQPQTGQVPTGTFGLTGVTEVVLVNLDGNKGCGVDDPSTTPLRQGWNAAKMCKCTNAPIPPLCGLMAFPPAGMLPSLVSPPLCAAQAANKSVACNGYLCSHTSCGLTSSSTRR